MNVANTEIIKRRRFGIGMPLRNDGFRKTLSPDPKSNINQGEKFLNKID